MKKKIVLYILSVFVGLLIPVNLLSEEQTELKLPHIFQDGQPARASEVNENFDTLKEAIEQLRQENQMLREQLELLPKTTWGLDEKWRPLAYTINDFEAQGEVVLDRATDLMWQQAGSPGELSVEEAQRYITSLSEQKFGGYDDWRLPTVPELMTLITPKKQSNDLYLDPLFDKTQRWCLSANRDSASGTNWSVAFVDKAVYRDQDYQNDYVRAVRGFRQSLETLAKKSTELSTLRSQTSPVTNLRNEPKTVTEEDARQVFGLTDNWTPQRYIEHQFEAQGEVVVDDTTGLMWQQSGSDTSMTYTDALNYVEALNRQNFAGYNDWRLPTIPELMSLLEPEKQSNDLHIDPVFDKTQWWCWSADTRAGSSESAWDVYFHHGNVGWNLFQTTRWVRCVRS